jgi:hypothetical protein
MDEGREKYNFHEVCLFNDNNVPYAAVFILLHMVISLT